MTGSASDDSKQPASANRAAEKGSGPTTGLMLAALLHAGLLAWTLTQSSDLLPPVRLPYGGMLAAVATGALSCIFLIAAFARRGALSFVVVPAMLVAGAFAHAVSAASSEGTLAPDVATGLLGFGALTVAITLSFGAAAIAARISPPWRQIRFDQSPAFRLGALGLVVVIGVAAISEQMAPLAALCATVGVVVLGASLNAVDRDAPHGIAMAELVSATWLSLGAIWAASIVAGARSASSEPVDWDAARIAMRFAWLAAMPLVLAVLVALLPRVTIAGAGVKRGRSTVLASGIGVITCIGLSEVVLTQSSKVLSARPELKLTSARHDAGSGEPEPAKTQEPEPAEAAESAEPVSAPSAPASSATDSPLVAPAAEAGDTLVLVEENEETKLSLHIKIDGPMLPKDAREGAAKSLKRLIQCYEDSDHRGEPRELRLGVLIDTIGSVKQAEPIEPKDANRRFVTCSQLAFYRSGFSSPPRHTWLELTMTFTPKG